MAAKKKAKAKKTAGPKKKASAKKTVGKRTSAPKHRTAPKKKTATRKPPAVEKKAGRRELIDTGTNKLFVRRNEQGTSFKKVVDAGKSIARDKQTKAKRKVRSGQGDKGDRR